MIDNELMKSEKFKKILIETFELKEAFKEKVVFTEDWISFFKDNKEDTESELLLKSFIKTEFLFMIDELIIGVCDKKYVICFNEGDYSFEFCGNTESNWISNAFGWGKNNEPKFQDICLKEFKVPIKSFNSELVDLNSMGIDDIYD